MLETEKSVVVAEAVEEPMAKSMVLVSLLLAWTESLAKGEVDAMPTLPEESVVPVPSSLVPKMRLPMLRVLLEVTAGASTS